MDTKAFEMAVYRYVAAIPPGKVATYGMLAAICGAPTWARRAARAMANAPEGLPCHRVVRRDGALAPEGVFENQRALLLEEGVHFLPSGRVDMRRSLWRSW